MSVKCEVVFSDDLIICNGKEISCDYGDFIIDGELYDTLEEAIKYCMEQSK